MSSGLKYVLRLMALFVLTLSASMVPGLVPGLAHGDPVPSNGTTPLTQWVPAGPASDIIRYQFYASDAAELGAMCVGQAPSCVPSLDLSDVPIGGNDLSPASGCVPSSTHVCAISDPRFWVTAPTIQLGQLQLDINNAASFWGITFCNGHDGVTAGSTNNCPSGPAGANIGATCLGATPANDCTKAAINVRQGFASLIDKVAFTIADKGSIGPGAVAMDNPLTPASAALHSGYDEGNNNPCTGGYPCTPGLANCGGTGCNPTGPYSAAVNTAVIPPALQTVAPGTAGAYNLGGVCSWDMIAGCNTTPISAFHYANDAVDSAGFVMPGSVDFCRAADHFIAAGLATGKNALCELTGESPALANGNILFYGQNSLGRHLLITGYTAAICELVNLGATTCSQVTSSIITLAQAHAIIFTGCKTLTEPGCTAVGPNTGWNLYASSSFFSTPTPDQDWARYDSAFASDLCGGSPGEESPNYDFICNTRHDQWVEASQFLGTPAAATLALQVAMDIFGNHTFNVPIWTPSVQYAYTKGWTGVSNAPGIGPAQGNRWSLLNMWNPNPVVKGPTIVWGQKDATASLNPFTYNSVVEADVLSQIYDDLLITNPFAPSQIMGWIANSYSVITAGGANCPTSFTNSRGTFTVGGCVMLSTRGDVSWHDIYNCAATDTVCLTSHILTASDVKFSFASFNATGGAVSPFARNVVDVVYSTSVLPPSLGGSTGAGVSETMVIYLRNLNAWALNDVASVPMIPQHLWVLQTAPKLANGVFAPCTDLGTPSCTVDPALTAGSQSDLILANKLVGSGPFVCASGPLGVSGTVVGGGCTFDSNGVPTGQAIPFGGSALLRRFANDQGTSPTSLDFNFAYFRTNAKYLQFQWAAFGANQASTGDTTSAINSCKTNSASIGGVNDYASCQHWNTHAYGLTCITTASTTCNAPLAGGSGTLPSNPIPVGIQINAWISRGAWCFGGPSCTSMAGTQPSPQTLYEDGSAEGSFSIASSTTSLTTPGTATIGLALSGGPDNNFTGTVPLTLSTVQTAGISAGLGLTSATLTPSAPTGSSTLSVNAPPSTGGTVIVTASSPNFPSVTVSIAVNGGPPPPLDSTSTSVGAVSCSIPNGAASCAAPVTATVADTTTPANIPTGTVTFALSPGSTGGSLSASSCTLGSTGTCSVSFFGTTPGLGSVSASYGGDSTHNTSTSSSATVTVTVPATPFDFAIYDSGGISVEPGSTGNNTISATLLSGTPQSTSLSCTGGLPAGASCSFQTPSGLPTFSTILNITTLSSTPTGNFTVLVTGSGGGMTHATTFTLAVVAPLVPPPLALVGQGNLRCSIIDPDHGFAYFATFTSPSNIVRVRLSDFSRNASLTLNTGENQVLTCVIDSAHVFAYFGTFTSPGIIVKVRLSDFTINAILTLLPGENLLSSSVIDSVNGFAYFATDTSPGIVVRVRLSDFTRNAVLTLTGQLNLQTAIIDPPHGFAYFGTGASPGVVVKIRLSDFTLNAALTLNSGENSLGTSDIDEVAGFAYFGTVTLPGIIVRVRLSDFSRNASMTLNPGENALLTSTIDPVNGFAYFGTDTIPGVMVRIRLSDFSRVDAPSLQSGDDDLVSVILDPSGIIYFGTDTSPDGKVVKVHLFDFAVSAPASVIANHVGVASNTITVTLLSGQTRPVTLECSGLPFGIQCYSFYPMIGTPPFTSYLTIIFTNSTAPTTTTFTIRVIAEHGHLTRSTTFTFQILGGSVGGKQLPVDKVALATPFIVLFTAVILPVAVVIVRRMRRASERSIQSTRARL